MDTTDELMLKRRIIIADGYLTDDPSKELFERLLLLDAESDEPIRLLINCGGGTAGTIFGFKAMLQMMKAPVITHCIGFAYSAAAIILALGEPGQRTAVPESRFLLHPFSYTMENEETGVIKAHLRMLEEATERVADLMTERTKLTKTAFLRLFNKETTFNAQQALEWGLIDKIVEGGLDD